MEKIVTTSFKLADGRTFDTRAEAEEAQAVADRKAKVIALLTEEKFPADTIDALAQVMAVLGKKLAAALTLPSKMGPKPKVAA